MEQRHQATHDRIPSLPYLSKSRLAALEWLRTNYWHVQDTAHDDLKAVIVTKIKEYKALSLEKNYKQQRKLVEDITSLLSQDDFQELLVPVFIDEVLTVVQTLTTPEMISLHESSISNEIKSWKVFIDTCILDFPQFMVILFERLLTLKPSPTITEWIRYILTNTIFSKDDTLVLLKLCFENEKCNNVKDFLKIIMTFKSMPEEGHRYYILLDYLLGSTNSIKRSGDGVNKLDIDDEMLLDKVNKQIEIVKGKLESLDTPLPESNSKWVLVEGINCQVGEIEEDGDLDLDPSYDDLTWLNSNNMLFIPVLEKLEEARESSALGDDDVEIDQSKLIIY